MAYLNICGFETGDTSEARVVTGTASIQGTVKRTGAYALQVSAPAGASGLDFGLLEATGVQGDISFVATKYLSCYIYIAALPTTANGFQRLIAFDVSPNVTEVASLMLATGGQLQLNTSSGTTTIMTPSLNTWYRIDFKATKNGACEILVDGANATTGTGRNNAATNVSFGCFGADSAINVYFDDIAISDSAYPGAGQVNILKPNADGNYTNKTSGTYADVDEVPHDSGTTKIVQQNDNASYTAAMESAATGGVSGSIGTVKPIIIVAEKAAGTDPVKLRLRSSTTDSDATQYDTTATYTLLGRMYDTDPATSAVWTSSAIDAMEVGFISVAPLSNGFYVTAVYAMVWSTGASAVKAFKRTLLGVGV